MSVFFGRLKSCYTEPSDGPSLTGVPGGRLKAGLFLAAGSCAEAPTCYHSGKADYCGPGAQPPRYSILAPNTTLRSDRGSKRDAIPSYSQDYVRQSKDTILLMSWRSRLTINDAGIQQQLPLFRCRRLLLLPALSLCDILPTHRHEVIHASRPLQTRGRIRSSRTKSRLNRSATCSLGTPKERGKNVRLPKNHELARTRSREY